MPKITLQNLVISNVNHLKEFLITQELSHLSFFQLSLAFKSYKYPQVLIKYVEEKGVVPSDRIYKLRETMQNSNSPQKRISDLPQFSETDTSKDSGSNDSKKLGFNQIQTQYAQKSHGKKHNRTKRQKSGSVSETKNHPELLNYKGRRSQQASGHIQAYYEKLNLPKVNEEQMYINEDEQTP